MSLFHVTPFLLAASLCAVFLLGGGRRRLLVLAAVFAALCDGAAGLGNSPGEAQKEEAEWNIKTTACSAERS